MALTVREAEELPARLAEPTAAVGGPARTRGAAAWAGPQQQPQGTAASLRARVRGDQAGQAQAQPAARPPPHGTATAPVPAEEQLACPDDPLDFNTSVIQLFGKEVHGLHGVFTSVRVDVRPPGWDFNCREGGKAQRACEKGSAELPPAHPRKRSCRSSIFRSDGRTNLPPFYKQSRRLSFKVARKFLVG